MDHPRDYLIDIRRGDRWVVVVAHPDDETFGCDSLIAHAAQVGAEVTVVCATLGEAGDDGPGRIYVVEPIGPFEDDPNVTDKRFPGNPTRSYRTKHSMRIVDEHTTSTPHAPEVLHSMLANLTSLRECKASTSSRTDRSAVCARRPEGRSAVERLARISHRVGATVRVGPAVIHAAHGCA